MIDTAAIKARFPMSETASRYGLAVTRKGSEFVALCPFHAEHTPSFTLNDDKRMFHCFGCGANGDVIDLVAKLRGLTFQEAAAELDSGAVTSTPVPPAGARQPAAADPASTVKIIPVPAGTVPPSFEHPRVPGLNAVAWWAYTNLAGDVLGYDCRFEVAGDKEILPKVHTSKGWKWKSFPKPRPLYGLHKLALFPPAAPIVVVEGCKTADAAQLLLPGCVVVSWPGGSQVVKHADWSPLAGRKVVLFPDRDVAGHAAMWDAYQALKDVAAGIRFVDPPAGDPDGWDLADAEWTPDETWDYLATHVRAPAEDAPPRPTTPTGRAKTKRENQHEVGPEHFEPPPHDDAGDVDGEPFQLLGHDHGDYFYLARGAKQVLRLPASGHTKSNLMMLAPLHFWEREYASKKGPDWDAACNALIQRAHAIGIYDPTRVRGRGAWWDDGVSVLHLGDRLVRDGKEYGVCDGMQTRYIYEAAAPIRFSTSQPLETAKANAFLELCKLLSWERPISAHLLAGWCVVAPICGALTWRPHVWVTGSAGTGKSWVYKNILARALGDAALQVASETTEAGIRQALGTDARPVIFDEADAETPRAASRIQNVLALMRQASSESGAAIYKGSAHGDSVAYRTRSCFGFASIGVGLQQHADQTRVSVLTLYIDPAITREKLRERFKCIEETHYKLMTAEYIDRLHARTIALIPVIRANAETFAVAGAQVLGTRRLGDQLGALLAGAYSLTSKSEISLEDAEKWMRAQAWDEEQEVFEDRDETKCLRTILQHVVRVNVPDGSRSATVRERTIGELVAAAAGADTDPDSIPVSVLRDTLLRMGIRTEVGFLHIANNHGAIAKILALTPWATNWSRILRRVDGAKAGPPERFAGPPDRVTIIPLYKAFGE